MKVHAEAFRADPRWLFLTGSRANIDLVRYRLGERSRKLSEHRSDVLLRNDVTGEWARDSAFADIGRLVHTIRTLDPKFRNDTKGLPHIPPTASSGPIEELPGQALFEKACASCHSIGRGDRVGPDLNGVTARRSADWISRFIQHPARMRASGDPYIADLVTRFPAVRMPNLQLSDTDAADILSYLKARSFAVTASARDATAGQPIHHHHGHHVPAAGPPPADREHDGTRNHGHVHQ